MAVINELIRTEADKTLSFGNYELAAKTKQDGFKYDGDIYKIKTFKEITKLEKNGMFVYESVPGTAVHEYSATDKKITFKVESYTDAQITLELEEDKEYKIVINGDSAGTMKTNLGGKLNFSIEIDPNETYAVEIDKL